MHAFSYASELSRMDRVAIAGFCDEHHGRGDRVREMFNFKQFSSYEALASSSDVDVILVTTETVFHADVALLAFEHGKDVIVEKPIATTLVDARRMIDAARKHGRRLFQCYPCRYHPSSRKTKELIDSGEVGDILGISATNHGCMPDHGNPETAWFSSKQLAGGGAVMDHTTHAADLIFWFTGWTPARVFGVARRLFHDGIDVDDAGSVLVTHGNGVSASIDPSWSRPASYPTWGDLTMVIYGSKMTVSIDMFNQNVNIHSNKQPRSTEWRSFSSNVDAIMLEDYVDAILHDGEPPVTGDDGLKALKVALDAYLSNERGQVVDW